MAGNYPDPPGHRMAYDRDGTVGFVTRSPWLNIARQISPAEMVSANDEVVDGAILWWSNSGSGGMILIFPELRSVTGAVINHSNSTSSGTFEWSPNTTNGLDGDWFLTTTPIKMGDVSSPVTLRNATPLALSGVKGLRWYVSGGNGSNHRLYGMHVYGQPEVAHGLRIWHPTLDQEVDGAWFDWGDVPRATSADRTFRVKNASATYTAQAPVLSLQALTDTTPSVPGQHLLSANGSTFGATATLADLAPGHTSGPVTIRRATPSDAAVFLWWARLIATASAWVL